MKKILYGAALFVLMSGCDTRRDILEEKGTWVRVQLDWSATTLDPARATVVFYPDQSGLEPIYLKTNERLDSVLLHASRYHVLAFNETPAGFANNSMRGMDAYATAEVYANPLPVTTQRSTDQPAAVPDLIAVDRMEWFELTWTMIRRHERPLLIFKPRHLIVPVHLLVHIKGVDNAAVSGSVALMSGLAEGVMEATALPTNNPVIHAFTLNDRAFAPDSYKDGTMTSLFNSFDLVNLDGARSRVTLRFLLRDNSIYTVERDVTALIERIPTAYGFQLEVEIGLGTDDDPEIILPEVPDAAEPGTGFDAVVDPWGDEERIDIEL